MDNFTFHRPGTIDQDGHPFSRDEWINKELTAICEGFQKAAEVSTALAMRDVKCEAVQAASERAELGLYRAMLWGKDEAERNEHPRPILPAEQCDWLRNELLEIDALMIIASRRSTDRSPGLETPAQRALMVRIETTIRRALRDNSENAREVRELQDALALQGELTHVEANGLAEDIVVARRERDAARAALTDAGVQAALAMRARAAAVCTNLDCEEAARAVEALDLRGPNRPDDGPGMETCPACGSLVVCGKDCVECSR